jgi:hypothetical protein
MANTISVRSSQVVQFNLDTNGAGATAPKLTLLCNRDYNVVDYLVLVTAAAGGAGNLTVQSTDIQAVPVTTTIGFVTGVAANAYQRPTQSNVAANTGYLPASAVVVRGGTLTLASTDAGDFSQGYLTILPGNRYSAVTSGTAYYANNVTSGAQGSSAVASI